MKDGWISWAPKKWDGSAEQVPEKMKLLYVDNIRIWYSVKPNIIFQTQPPHLRGGLRCVLQLQAGWSQKMVHIYHSSLRMFLTLCCHPADIRGESIHTRFFEVYIFFHPGNVFFFFLFFFSSLSGLSTECCRETVSTCDFCISATA